LPRFDRLEFDQEPELGLPGVDQERDAPEASHDQASWMNQADEQRRRGLHENALRFYSRALERDSSLVTGWLGQVQMLVLLGEYPEAELWARKSLEIFKNHGDLLAARAQALARIGDLTKAMELADAALCQEGDSAYRWMVRGELMVSSRDEVDRHCFDKAVVLKRDWLVPLESALIYLHYEQPSKGLLRARQAVEISPQSFYAWFVEGECEQALEFDRQAETSFQRVLELSPRHVDASRKLCELANQGWSLKRGLRRVVGRLRRWQESIVARHSGNESSLAEGGATSSESCSRTVSGGALSAPATGSARM
jgi:tetratricopeptide (TPR) repeat protein